jgi:DNA-binding GntR family transcriptional regulator
MSADVPFETKTERVYALLRDRILDGTLRSGQRLRLEPLAEEFSTSHMPIREALRMLQRDGLVEFESHRGAMVTAVTWERVYEAVLTRMHLETIAAREATPHHDGATVAALERSAMRMDTFAERGHARRFSEENRAFHTALYEPCPYRLLKAQIQSLWDAMWRTRSHSLFHLDPARMTAAQREHRLILDAVREGDAEGAEARAAEHRDRTLDAWRRVLEGRRAPPVRA